MPACPVSLLQQREIEARVAAPLIAEFAALVGWEAALNTAARAVQRLARAAGRQAAEAAGADSLEALAGVVENLWARNGALEIEILRRDATRLFFNVTGCRYAELYVRLGARECGFVLSCSRDAAFAAGFNPRIRLQRGQTIMSGALFCDFRFTLDG
jgi:hypothetical protein